MAPAARLLQLFILLCLRPSADCATAPSAVGTKDPAVQVDLLASSALHRNDPILVAPRRSDRRKGQLMVQPGTAVARKAFRRRVAATSRGQDGSGRDGALALRGASAHAGPLARRRAERSAGRCLSAPIAAGNLSDPLLLLRYESSEQFKLCLGEQALRAGLAPLLQQPLPLELLRAVKRRLRQVYPEGIPEEQLKLLGPLSRLYSAEEISTWTVTSNDTLAALLDPAAGKWKAPQVQHLITRYLDLGGVLTGPLLQSIGGRNLCSLDEEHVSCVTPAAIGCAGPLDISSCSQAKKNLLYAKAQEAFAGQAGTQAYYSLIQPYLGGAPAEDLKDLAKTGIAMDIDTFTALNPEELQKLSVVDVKNLLGIHLPDLKQVETLPAVISWIRRQDQWELDHVLGIGLQGGIVKPSPTGAATPAPVTPSAPTATAVPATTITATGSSTSAHASPTPSSVTTAPPHTHSTLPGAGGSPAVTSRFTTRPAPAPSSTSPCSVHPTTPSMTTTSPAGALPAATPAAVHPSTMPASPPPRPALTGGTTTPPSAATDPWAVTTANTNTPVVSMNPPAPAGATNPAPSTPNTTTPTSASSTPQEPTLIPRTSVSTQGSATSPAVTTTTCTCQTGAPPPFLSPSSTTTSSETTKKTPTDVPEPLNPTPVGYINLPPEAGSGSRLSCPLHVLPAALGISLLRGLL